MNYRVRAAVGVVQLILVLLVSACGPVAGSPTPVPSAAVGGDPLIVLKTTGTVAGIDTELRISGSGFATLYDKGKQVATRQMNSSTLPEIEGLLEDGDFFNLEERYDKGGVSDDKYYELTYTKGGRSKTVVVAEVGGQGLTPKRVLDVIAKLTQFEWQMTYKRQP